MTGEINEVVAAENFVVDAFESLIGRSLTDVRMEVLKHKAAGQAEMDYILANPNSHAANLLKNDRYHFFFGAADSAAVPCLEWDGGKFHRGGNWLTGTWTAGSRAVLCS